MKNIIPVIIILLSLSISAYSQDSNNSGNKATLDHSVYDKWNTLGKVKISKDGNWTIFEVNPLKGDGKLFLQNLKSGEEVYVERGYDAVFSANSDFIVFKIKPEHETIRKAKLNKKKPDEMPKDTAGILLIDVYNGKVIKDSIIKISGLKSFSVPEEKYSVIGILSDQGNEKDSVKKSSFTKDGNLLTILNFKGNVIQKIDNVAEAVYSKKNNVISYVKVIKDTSDKSKNPLNFSEVYVYNTEKDKSQKIFNAKGKVKKLTIDNSGKNAAFLFSKDTTEVKRHGLYYWNELPVMNPTGGTESAKLIADTSSFNMPADWEVSENSKIYFSDNGTKLYFGTAPKKIQLPKDTIPEDEKFKVDVWNWQDATLQTQQLKELDSEKKKSYLAVYHSSKNNFIQLADETVDDIRLIQKGDGEIALGISEKPYLKYITWIQNQFKDYYIVDVNTGEKRLALTKKQNVFGLSPEGKFILYYEPDDSMYYSFETATGLVNNITSSIPEKLFDELNDVPSYPQPYGIAGWTKDDEFVYIYDRFDIWKVNPAGNTAPENITSNGRETKTEYRYIRLDREKDYISGSFVSTDLNDKILLYGKNTDNYKEGFYRITLNTIGNPEELMLTDNSYMNILKAKDKDIILFQKMSYREFYDLWKSDASFISTEKISNANPQTQDYKWGDMEIVSWSLPDGRTQKGILYKPENLDESKKYPMIVYFYEKYTDRVHTHYIPNPSRSVINFPLYNSNDYLVFIPDIDYKIGYPGQSCYDAVMSGTMALCERQYVDRDRIGIQGQSWGGYQVAYLVTQTNFFKAAMSGAPVSNMTSAYGGIRWESGLTRIFQYEQGQSRIGGTLWDSFELYYKNSPLFFTDKITTPLLIMANDNDGAVPWYQGIEFFNSLRRLDKTAYMLTYNGDEHNLIKWPNRVDLSIRMKQFFDFYLKDAPMPDWMREGVHAIDKGLKTGY